MSASESVGVRSIFWLPLDYVLSTRLYGSQPDVDEKHGLDAAQPAASKASRSGTADGSLSKESGGATCSACGIGYSSSAGFSNAEEQRAHFKTDWHRFNVKRVSVYKKLAVSEEAFEQLLEQGSAVRVSLQTGEKYI